MSWRSRNFSFLVSNYDVVIHHLHLPNLVLKWWEKFSAKTIIDTNRGTHLCSYSNRGGVEGVEWGVGYGWHCLFAWRLWIDYCWLSCHPSGSRWTFIARDGSISPLLTLNILLAVTELHLTVLGGRLSTLEIPVGNTGRQFQATTILCRISESYRIFLRHLLPLFGDFTPEL